MASYAVAATISHGCTSPLQTSRHDQNYQKAPWGDLLDLWRFFNLHLSHVIRTVNEECIDHIWVVDEDTYVTLGELMIDYLRHLNDHLQQINNCIDGMTQQS